MDWQLALRVFYASLFALSAMSKALHPTYFVAGVREYGLLPAQLVATGASVVVLTETVLPIVLVVVPGPLPWVATIAALSTFTLAQAWSVGRGREHACHCFGGDEPVGVRSLGRTLALALVALAAPVFAVRLDPVGSVDPTPGDWLAYLVAVLTAAYLASSGTILGRFRGRTSDRAPRLGVPRN